MDYKKTMEYLSILLDMEKNIYIQEKTINFITFLYVRGWEVIERLWGKCQ